MAQLQIQEQVVVPAVLGAVSGGAQLLQDNIKASGEKRNVFLRNAGAVVDYGVTGLAVLNHMMDLGYPRRGSSELAASAIAIGVRRGVQQLGDVVLGLERPIVKAPSAARTRSAARFERQPAEVLEFDDVIVNRT